MADKNDDNWQNNYLSLKAYVELTGHFPNKHTKLCNWVKYQRKRIKYGLMTEEQKVAFLALCEERVMKAFDRHQIEESHDTN